MLKLVLDISVDNLAGTPMEHAAAEKCNRIWNKT